MLRLGASLALAVSLALNAASPAALAAERGQSPLTVKHPKLDSQLAGLARTAREGIGSTASSRVDVVGRTIQVAVTASGVAAARTAITKAGGVVEDEYLDLLLARLPLASLETIAADHAVRSVTRPERLHEHAVISQGLGATNVAAWHAAGATGAGIKVAIIDSGFAGYKSLQTKRELPTDLVAIDYCGGKLTTGPSHGSAVAEIVYDMAPQAKMYLICVDSSISLGRAKDYAIAQRINVINFSAGFYASSRGDGSGGAVTPEGIATSANAAGILWVNSAGNAALAHWSGTFVDADGDQVNEFAPATEANRLSLAVGQEACVYLKWDSWPIASVDYDLSLQRSNDKIVVAGSANAQTGFLPPSESICYLNPGPQTEFDIVVTRDVAASTSPRLDLYVTAGTLARAVADGSVVEPATAPSVLAVGAICWSDSVVARYSSRGPTIDGRVKPDISASTAVSTVTYGSTARCSEVSGFPGTSSAAPHVAGAAVLIKQQHPEFGPAQIVAFLGERAIDLGISGKDNAYGAGSLTLGSIAAAPATAQPGQIFLPNVTKTLGGPSGWTTPVAIQNTGASDTTATVRLYKFSDGSEVATVLSPSLKPAQAWLFDPSAYANLPGDTQFSVVVQPLAGGSLGAVVLEGAGSSWMTYAGAATGAPKVYLPNVLRRLGGESGWSTPFIVQNLGTTAATVSILFYDFASGALAKRIDGVKLEPGRAQPFLPWAIDGLADGGSYGVVVEGSAGAQLYAIVNEHAGAQAMSYEGISSGGALVYLPNIVKHLGGPNGWSTPFIVQNVGATSATFSLEFYSFVTGQLVITRSPMPIEPGRSKPFDIRVDPPGIPPGQYAIVVRGSPGAQLAAIVNQHEFTAQMAMSYAGLTAALPSAYLPYVQNENGAAKWVSPIIAQNLGSAVSDVTVTLFDPAGAVVAQKVFPKVAPGAAAVYDPRFDPCLAKGVFSGLVQADQAVAAVLNHSANVTGDYAMSYVSTPGPLVAIRRQESTLGGVALVRSCAGGAKFLLEKTVTAADQQRILATAAQDLAFIEGDFARKFQPAPTIVVFATTTSYKRGLAAALGISATDATRLGAFRAAWSLSSQTIALDWQRLAAETPFTAVRELLASLLSAQLAAGRGLPPWFRSGLALAEEVTRPESRWVASWYHYGAASMAATGTLFTLADMSVESAWDARTGEVNERQEGAAIAALELLRADLSMSGIVRLLELVGAGRTFEDAFATVAGRTLAAFSAEFPQRVRAFAPAYPGAAVLEGGPEPGAAAVLYYGFTPGATATSSITGVASGGSQRTVSSYGTVLVWIGSQWPDGGYTFSLRTATQVVSVKLLKGSVAAPTLSSPPEGAVLPNMTPTCTPTSPTWRFSWSAPIGRVPVLRYQIEVRHVGSAFAAIDVQTTSPAYSATMCGGYIAEGNLTNWQWRVRAIYADDIPGPWSAPRTFSVAPLVP